ncbi:helix-turn-helix domain-containing protein [Lysinibacter cavernae]|nr:helix-turn-helix domain-containing protein [Lysinibacter cavernae]
MLIGARLRSTRRAQGLTIDQVAEATGLTKGFISRVERDATSPSVATLVTLCQVLSLPIGSLFDAPVHEVITLDAAPRINMGGTGADERMLTPRSEARVQVLRSRLEAGATGGAEMYTINCDVEVLHVLSGSVVLHLTGEDIALQAGDTVTFSGQEPHNWSNPGDTVAEVMWTIAPAAWSGSS